MTKMVKNFVTAERVAAMMGLGLASVMRVSNRGQNLGGQLSGRQRRR
jgi:hypothetical protein